MTRKDRTHLLQACLVVFLILTYQSYFFVMITAQVSADTIAKVYVEPSQYNATKVGETFTANINIANVKNLYSYELKLYYNRTLLKALSANFSTGHILTPSDPTNLMIVKRERRD